MNGAELVELSEAARAFGIAPDALRERLDGGMVPEAVRHEDIWALPAVALAHIAQREGWSLDLTAEAQSTVDVPEELERYINETLAAHAAVVLAKTQATAARAETEQLARKVKAAAQDLDAERAERERATAELARAQTQAAELDKLRAVAEARNEEIRQQLAHERAQRSFLTQRISTLERERDELHTALGWLGRWRVRQSQPRLQAPAHPATWTTTSPRAEDGHGSRQAGVEVRSR